MMRLDGIGDLDNDGKISLNEFISGMQWFRKVILNGFICVFFMLFLNYFISLLVAFNDQSYLES